MHNVIPRLRLIRSFIKLLRDPEATEHAFGIIDALHDDPSLRGRFPFDPAIQRFIDDPFLQNFPDLDAMRRLPRGRGHSERCK